MSNIIIINPDHYLETESGRVWSAQQNKIAWQHSYNDFERALIKWKNSATVYIVFGVQAAGKTSWIENTVLTSQTPTVFFDAAMPAVKHRQKVISIAKQYRDTIIAVWIRASLVTAMQRNSNRAKDKRVPENAIKSVYSQLQAPTLEEGFSELIIVNQDPIYTKTASNTNLS